MNIHEIEKLNEEIRQLLREEKQLDFCNNLCYNINEAEEKLFIADIIPKAQEQLQQIPEPYHERILIAIRTFEQIGTRYKNLNNLGNGLYEIKPEGVRAYFKYHPTKRKIIVVGFICLKQTQKAPKQNIKQANKNIDNYIKEDN